MEILDWDFCVTRPLKTQPDPKADFIILRNRRYERESSHGASTIVKTDRPQQQIMTAMAHKSYLSENSKDAGPCSPLKMTQSYGPVLSCRALNSSFYMETTADAVEVTIFPDWDRPGLLTLVVFVWIPLQ